ncbi:MAG: LPS assembly protein LptD [Deltaproteobacteria bacterium]|nr:LPS assembly protein LptD [Deltaproteobacteria bacterium]
MIAILIFISCPGASAVETQNNENSVNIETGSMDGGYFPDISRVQGKVTVIYKGPAPDAEDIKLDNKNNITATPEASAAETQNNGNPVNIEADSMDYDNSRDVYHAKGKVNIVYSGSALYADDMELDNKNNVATAQGSAFLRMGEDTLQGDKIVFNIADKTGAAYKAHAFYARNHFYIKGDKIEKTGENTYFISQPYATTCDGDDPAWAIAGSEMKVTIEGYGLMKNARFLAKGIPVLYSPFLPFPAKTKRQSGLLLPYLSYSRDKDGVDIEIPFFWAISPQMDATFYQRFIEKRGFKEGAEFRYFLGDNSSGVFYGDYIDDSRHVTETTDPATSRDWQESHRRWSYYLNHQTNFDPQFYVRTDLIKVSDKWYFKDFSAHNYYLDNYNHATDDLFKNVSFQGDQSLRYLESTARLYKGWSNFNLTGMANTTEDFAAADNDQTLQKYPEIVLTGIKQPLLKTPLYYEFAGTYDYFYRGEGQKGHYVDFSPTISAPFNLSRYVKVIPQFAFKETFWSRDDNSTGTESKSGDRTIYNASLALNSQISRVFDVKVQNWEKIRHEIKPEITYSYVPNVNQDDIPDYLPLVFPVIMPLTTSAGNVFAEQNAVAWSLTNTLTARVKDEGGSYSYLEFLRLKLFQTYDIHEANKNMGGSLMERRPFSDMGIELNLSPHKYISFSARNLYSFYDDWKQTNYDLNLKDSRGDELMIGYRYTLHSIEEVNFNLRAIITPSIYGTLISRRDLYNSKTIENTLGFVYHTQCWSMGLDFTETENDTRFLFKISLAGLGKLGF